MADRTPRGTRRPVCHPAVQKDKEAKDTLISIDEIIVNPGRRELDQAHVQSLADSMAVNGLMCSITIGVNHILIAGFHRLEAAKRLGWVEIECMVLELTDLQAQLAEIDENVVRKNLSGIEYNDLLLRRKEIYEALHPETRRGGDRVSEESKLSKCQFGHAKSFLDDTAEKMGISPRTVARQIQTAKNLTSDAKQIIKESGTKLSKKGAMQLSRLQPEQQSEAATMLASGQIRSVDEYAPVTAADSQAADQAPPALPFQTDGKGKRFDSFEEALADMKDPDKDCSATADTFLTEISYFIRKFLKGIKWYDQEYYKTVFPLLNDEQMEYLHAQTAAVCAAAEDLYNIVERTRNK